jgi:hypothetical protein
MVNQTDDTGRVPLQSAAISHTSASHRASGGVHRGVGRPADRLRVRLGRSCASTSIRHCLTYVCLCLLHALSCSLALAYAVGLASLLPDALSVPSW